MVDAQQRALYQRFLPSRDPHTYVWKYSQATGGRRPRHFHAEPEVNLVVRGSATFGIGDGAARVSRGDLIAFPSGQDHALVEGSPDLYLYAMGLDPAYSTEVLGAGRAPVVPLHVRLSDDELAVVQDRAAAIVDRGSDPARLNLPTQSLVRLEVPTYAPEACPLCAKGIPVVKPGSRAS